MFIKYHQNTDMVCVGKLFALNVHLREITQTVRKKGQQLLHTTYHLDLIYVTVKWNGADGKLDRRFLYFYGLRVRDLDIEKGRLLFGTPHFRVLETAEMSKANGRPYFIECMFLHQESGENVNPETKF